MPFRSLIKDTIPLQGFRVCSIEKYYFGINIKIVPDRRYRQRCGKCNHIGKYRDTRPQREKNTGSKGFKNRLKLS